MVELLKVMQQGVINKVSDPQSSFTEAVQRKKKIKKSRHAAISVRKKKNASSSVSHP